MSLHILANTHKKNRTRRNWLAGLVFLTLPAVAILPVTGARGQQDLTERQKLVAKSLARGIEHLRSTQLPQGTWPNGPEHPIGYAARPAVGYAAMPALALLEVGVPTTDITVQKAAQFVRAAAPRMEETYDIALGILFLDRLGEAKDVPLIRGLGYRLIAGQGPGGGWSYRCAYLSPVDEELLMNFLKKNEPKFANTNAVVMHPSLRPLPKSLERLVDPLVKKEREAALQNPISDPTKTILPDLIAKDPNKKPEAPPKYAPGKPEIAPPPLQNEPKGAGSGGKDPLKKDAKSDTPKSGSENAVPKKQPAPAQPTSVPIHQWPTVAPYVKQMMLGARADVWAKGQQVEDNSNTQFAILGLWVARKHGVPTALTLVRLDQRFRSSQFADGSWSYRVAGHGVNPKQTKHHMATPAMTCVGLMGLGVGHGAFQEAALAQKKNPAPPDYLYDPAIQKGLAALSTAVDPRISLQGIKVNLYYFWSLERVMVMYQLQTLGGVDWHAWGTDILLSRQTPRGSWFERGYFGSSEPIDTAMAMLFLSRANLNRDLTESLRRYVVVIDPARAKAP